jgi:hypothetical protein
MPNPKEEYLWNATGRSISGSEACVVVGSDEAALNRLWREKRREAEPADPPGDLSAQLGAAARQLNRSWYERRTGRWVVSSRRTYLGGLRNWRFLSRTPGPPPFSSMNSTPARSSALRMALCVSGGIERLIFSKSTIVDSPSPAAWASSGWVMFNSARAPLH